MRPTLLPRPELFVGAIMIVVLMGTALVSPLYPIYQRVWELNASEVTRLYVIYMLGALLSLLVFGRLADQLGYRRVMGAALVLALCGTLGSIFAPDYALFCIARFLVGIAASLITTSGTVAVIRMMPEARRATIPLLTSLYVSAGFALGPILGGLLGQWAENPLVTAHLPSLVLLLAACLVFFALPKASGRGGFSLKSLIPQLSWTTPEHSRRLALALCLPFLGFGNFGLYASLAPMLIRNFTGWSGPVVSGLYIGTFLVGTAIFQIVAGRFAPQKGAVIALVLMALGSATMCLNLAAGSVILFALGVAIASIGHGFCMLSSTAIMHGAASEHNRGGLSATYWAVGYAGSIFPLLLLGWASDLWGMESAVAAFCIIVALLSLIVAALFVAIRPKR